MSLLVWLAAATRAAAAEPPGATLQGAGGPLVASSVLWNGGRSFLLTSVGGAGYAYLGGGRLRLGGRGQHSLYSTRQGGVCAALDWGGLLVAYDPLGSAAWELPVGLSLGGGRLTVERTVSADTLVERHRLPFFTLQLFAGVERRLARTFELAVHASYQLGVHAGPPFHVAELTLFFVFLQPRPRE